MWVTIWELQGTSATCLASHLPTNNATPPPHTHTLHLVCECWRHQVPEALTPMKRALTFLYD